jgi:hypothetical protein
MSERLAHPTLTYPTTTGKAPGDDAITIALREFSKDALEANTQNLSRSMKFIDDSFGWLRIAYSAMLVFGLLALIAAVVKGLIADGGSEVAAAAVLGGVSVGTLISAFIIKPTDSMERNSIFVPWMLVVLNTYWTRLLYMNDPAKEEEELKEAGNVANEQFKAIAEALAKAQNGDTETIKSMSGGGGGTSGSNGGGDDPPAAGGAAAEADAPPAVDGAAPVLVP